MTNIQRSADPRFFSKVSNFSENLYKISDRNSLIFKLLYTVLENGVGQLKGIQDMANMSQSALANTEGSDLDDFYQLFGIKRNNESIYSGSLFSETNVESIQEYQSGDSKFRVLIAKFLQSLQKGATRDGIRLMAEAASGGYPVHVLEPWHDGLDNVARIATINETVVFVIIDDEITKQQQMAIKSRVINGLEMLRPLGSLFTVKILVPKNLDDQISAGYASAGSFMFLSDGRNQHVELLSQEKEIEINSFVVEANPFIVDNSFSTLIGNLLQEGDLDTSLVVEETDTVKPPVFFILLTNGEDSEIALVYNRFSFEQDGETLFVYEVSRAQLGTQQIDWNNKMNIKIQTNLTQSLPTSTEDTEDSDVIPIPKADSPDNYPQGRNEGNPTSYDADGNYIYEWASQEEFEAWFLSQIYDAGGKIITDGYYKMPGVTTLVSGQTLIAALNPSGKILRPKVRPKSNV